MTATGGSVSGTATTTVTVTAQPVPIVTVTCNKIAAATASCVVSATLSGAIVPSADITHVAWDWGNGDKTVTNAPNANVSTHVYTVANIYTVVASGVVVPGTTATGTGSGTANVQ